jgi:hypothetical protein
MQPRGEEMACDLERIYGKLAADLPEDLECAEPFLLDESVIPPAPAEMSTDKLVIQKTYQQRLPGCRGDLVDIIAPRSTIRQLGLAALAVLFHEQCDQTLIHLTNSESRLRHVVFTYGHVPKEKCSGFRVRPWALGYLPEDPPRALSTDSSGFGAPLFRLTNLPDCQHNEQDWQNRDTLRGLGDTFSTADVAQFLLDAGRSTAKAGRYTIPANSAFFTAEVVLWTPEAWQCVQQKLTEWNRGSRSPESS